MRFFRVFLLVACGLGIAWAAQDPVEEQATVEALSEEELDAEMQRIEQALGETDEPKEFIPTKPLAADLPVALPSDI